MLMTAILMYAMAADPKPELLVEPKVVVNQMLPKEAVILDIRSAAKFEQGHLPGARNVSTSAWAKAVTAGTADEKFWIEQFTIAGIDPATMKPIVVAGDDMKEVCRAWWLLRRAGVEDVRVFNGKHKTFEDEGGKLSLFVPPVPAVNLKAWKPKPEHQHHKEDVLKQSQGGGTVIDARSKDEFSAGRVPKAKHLEWSELLDEKTGKFKPLPELQKLFKDHGIDPADSPTCYCASGGRASVLAFGVELVSGKPARNYYRSWTEWGNDPETPKEK